MDNHIKEKLIRNTFNIAKRSKLNGNLAYGCLLVDENNKILLEGENSVLTESDSLGHAEVNLIRKASKLYSTEFLNKCTIFTSDEPCPMCSSAIFWGGIGKLIFGLSKARFYKEFGNDNPNIDFNIPSRDILKLGGRKVEVEGPILEEEALLIHQCV